MDDQRFLEKVQTGEMVGRDPRKMTQEEFKALGHKPMTPIQALRARCVDCCGGLVQEVRYCTARRCPSWPFRMGTSPWRAERAPLTDEQKEVLRTRMAEANKHRKIVVSE